MNVRKVMSEKLITAAPDDGARQTFFRMRQEGVRHLPVVEDEKLVGIISDRDLRRPDWVDEAVDISHVYNLDDNQTVGSLMTPNVQAVHVYDSLHKATKIFLEQKFGCLPVLNREEELVGIVTPLDLLKALDELMSADMKKKD
jgi:acetoin utilization protein AcuB